MKGWIAVFSICALAGAGYWHSYGRKAAVVHAQTCDVTSLNGVYGFRVDGNFFDNQGYSNYLSAAGIFTADAQGGLSFKDTTSLDGSITRNQTYSGTYTVNSDCTGSITANSPAAGVALGFDFALVNNNTEMQVINTNGTNMTGTAKKQVIPAASAGN